MRVKKAWIVARKDMAEFRANKQILIQLVAFTMILSVLPVLIVGSLVAFTPKEPPKEPNLNLQVNATIAPGTYTNVHFLGVSINDSTVSTGYVLDSFVGNSTILEVVVRHSLLDNVTVSNSILIDCVLRNSNYDKSSTLLLGTVTSGSTKSPTEDLRALMPFFTHGVLLFMFFVMAIALPTTIAAYSFVGEKTNKTLEPLLASPLTDSELLWGKYLAVFVPVMALISIASVISTTIVDIITLPILGYILLPDAVWLFGIFIITPLVCLIGISVNVLISSKVNDVRTAQQYSSLIVFPVMMALFLGPSFLSLAVGLEFFGFLAVIFLGIMVLLIWLSLRVFNREDILTSWK